jgi:Transglutaminase-like superfamily
MRRLCRFLHLSWTDKALLLQAFFLLTVVRLGLWCLPFQTLRKLLARTAARGSVSVPRHSGQADPSQRVIWAVAVVGNHFPSIGTCLMQALAAHVLLGRRHCPAQLHIGVTRDGKGKFLGHAWLESNGNVILGGEALRQQHYTPLLAMDHLEH